MDNPPYPFNRKEIDKTAIQGWRLRMHEIIFEADSAAGRWFDILLIACILISVFVVLIDSVRSINNEYGTILYVIEWIFTLLFTVEYIFRLLCIGRPLKYASSHCENERSKVR
ncbi:MAG: ion transporter [Candidatus Hinthialibacter sp.]